MRLTPYRISYNKGNLVAFRSLHCKGREYLVVNTSKPWHDGHTHQGNLKQARRVIDLAYEKEVPYHGSIRLLKSLKRVSTDTEYIQKLDKLIQLRVEELQLIQKA